MTTKALRLLLMKVRNGMHPHAEETEAAVAEVESIEKAAKTLDRLHVGDYCYDVRDRAAGDASFTGNTWEHPNVIAWGEASETIQKIARDAP